MASEIMYKFVRVFFVCYIFMVAFILIDIGEANQTHINSRSRRYLAFMNSSRFYLKFNFKANMVPWNQLFAQAVGFRMNWNDPPNNFRPYHRIYRRAVYNYIETLLDSNGLSGFHCVRRAICEMQMIAEPQKIYHKLLEMVFRKISSATEKWHNTTVDECQTSVSTCPFSLLEVSRYTDIA